MRAGVRLGVDVGSVRVGLARCDPSGILATPVATLQRDMQADSDISQIASYAQEFGVCEIVVGMPLSLQGSQGAAAAAAQHYAEQLAARVVPVPVRLVDERLTTVSATQALRHAGRGGRKQRAVVDQAAAVMILQVALDAERNTGTAPGTLVQLPDQALEAER